MKTKKVSKLIGMLLVGAMLLGVTGCGNQNVESNNESSSAEKSSVAEKVPESSVDNSVPEVVEEEITYPLDTDDTLSIWSGGAVGLAAAYTDYKQSPFHTGLAERTGVEMEWMFPTAGTPGAQAYNLLLAEDELPDIIFYSISPADAEILIDDGVIYDLTEYLPVYAPDYWALINEKDENGNILKSIRTGSGKYYSFAHISEDEWNNTSKGPMIRQDWLDALGLDMPVTMDDWEEILIAFNDEYDAKLGLYLNNFDVGFASGVDAYGSLIPKLYVDDDGKVQLAQAQEEWKQLMEYYNKWWDMGLIDKDSLTMDDAAVRTKILNNEIGVTFNYTSRINNYRLDAETSQNGANWVGAPYPRTAEGNPTSMIHTAYNTVSGVHAVITTSCPEDRLITALKCLNYGYTEEGIKYWNFGEEGVSYYVDEKGEIQWTEMMTEHPDGLSESRSMYTGCRSNSISMSTVRVVKMGFSDVATAAVDGWVENTEGPSHCVPNLSLTEQENVTYSDLYSVIKTYVSEEALKFLTGERSLDEFDAFVEELNKLELGTVLEIQQAGYDRYMN